MARELIIIGDRVLIKPDNKKEMTNSGLYLPQGAYEKEKVHSGKIIKVGPGIPVPATLINDHWFFARALGDQDHDGTESVFWITSVTSRVAYMDETE